ncbi:hypothetical protein FQR65_LT13742 [Abscondita terminalis]|nr:hypothetical protein FQR65_LT13742 [Abscondita terminalis]
MDYEISKTKRKNPRETANPLSVITFCFTLPTFFDGLKKELQINDLYEAFSEHKSSKLGDKLEAAWLKEVKIAEECDRTPSLRRALIKTFGLEYFMYGFIWFLGELCFKITQPILLGELVAYYMNNYENITQIELYLFSAGIVGCSLMAIFITHPTMYGFLHIGMKARVACCSLIYRKSLKLSKTSLEKTTIGQTVNLLSNDVNRFDVAAQFMHQLWVGPLEIIIVTYFMYEEVGVPALLGIIVLLLFIPLQLSLGKVSATYRLRTALRTDERVRLMNEIISGIQVIKMYTWEKPFEKIVAFARRHEIKSLRITSYIRACVLSFSLFTTRLSLFITVLAYVLWGFDIDARKAFILTGFYNVVQQSMTIYFPIGVIQVAELNVSVKRLNKFLLYDEIQLTKKYEDGKNGKRKTYGSTNKKNFTHMDAKVSRKEMVFMQYGTAKWSESSTGYILRNVNLNIERGSLVAVIGPVGSGKTSLLNAILKELPLVDGSLEINGTISYASQEPWLFPGNVRQNIIFGHPWQKTKYDTVVKKCSLERDLELFPYGDRTIVGERGVSLSGGQRTRINLARAIYKDADIYLLDDPLSAVDTHVGKELFEKCIKEYLKEKTIILVTHQVQHLKEVDRIIILENGKIKIEGTYQELQSSGLDFAKLLRKDSIKDIDEEDDIELPLRKGSYQRQNSVVNLKKSEKVGEEPLVVEEQRTSGSVSGSVYIKYFKSGANTFWILLLILIFLLAQFFASFADYFLAYWVNLEQVRSESDYINLTLVESNFIKNAAIYVSNETLFSGSSSRKDATSDENDFWYFSRETCIYVYTATALILIVVTLIRSFSFYTLCMNASIRLHDNMFNSIIHATMRFFNTNTSGRILNRFSKDMGSVDELLPTAMLDALQITLIVVGIIIVVGVVNYWLMIPTFITLIVFFGLRKFYLTSSRSIKRLEGITRSPVFAYMNASLQGLTTIRAYGAESILEAEFDNHQDLHSSAWYLYLTTSRAFGCWLDLVCVVYIAIVTISFLTIVSEQFGGNVGLGLTQAISLTGLFQWGMRQVSEVENQMTSVERVLEYGKIEHERDFKSASDKTPPKSWPKKGKIQFIDLSLTYSSQDPPVLQNLNFIINPLEKIGIVGRTGAGKSSMITALFQLTETTGLIIIDNIDIQTLGLHDLRSKISIIPQEPVLFSGTLRKNLDPFDEYTDDMLWKALEECELKETVIDLTDNLNSIMSGGGSNFSVGQRQLVCLARAIIRNNKILVLDEATANVDPQTDALIQKTIRKKFGDCTVLTIAHRLDTVMDSDKIMVMDAGRLLEFDHPYVLLQNRNSIFYSMVQQTGSVMADALAKIARRSYKRLHASSY